MPSYVKVIREILILFLLLSAFSQSQAQSALPAGKAQISGGIGAFMNFFLSADYALSDDITLGAEFISRDVEFWIYGDLVRTSEETSYLLNSNYHFNSLFNMSDSWDYYAGISAGYHPETNNGYSNENQWFPGAQMGCRYFPASFLGLHAELALKNGAYAKIGLTIRLG